jgi:bacillithiol system protein YtxJ
MSELTPLSTLSMLEAAIAESLERPVLLFKHSRYCGVSCEALDEVRAWLGRGQSAASGKMITVQSNREVSDDAARRLGIRHETPQAIVLRDGRPVWSASHFRITSAELDRVLSVES